MAPWLRSLLLLLALAPLGAAAPAGAQDDGSTEVVAARPGVATVEVEGVFAPREAVEVAYEAEAYGGPLEVLEAVPARRVAAGEVLVRFDEEEGRRLLGDAQRELEAARLRLERLSAETRHKEALAAIQLDQLERHARRADEALARFLAEDRPLKIAQAELGMQSQEDRLQEQVEELEQLEKMYKADDLTEETEEIVLRRARRALERSRRSFEFARQRHRLYLDVQLPEEEADLRMGVRERRSELEGHRATARYDQELATKALDKAVEEDRCQKERLQDLQKDVDGLRLVAPVAGLAVPGRFQDGKWQDFEETRRLLAPGKRVKAGQVLYTIVHPGNVRLDASVAEKDLPKLKPGQSASVESGLAPGRRLAAVVGSIEPVGQGGRYGVVLDLKETDASLLVGSSGKAKIAAEAAVLTVPAAALRAVDGKPHVWVLKDGIRTARAVEVGATCADGRFEVVGGLEAGESILVTAPEDAP